MGGHYIETPSMAAQKVLFTKSIKDVIDGKIPLPILT